MTAPTSRRPLNVIGMPSSAGSYAAGQDQAPRVLREHRLLDRLRAEGRTVTDVGDGPLQVWTPDPEHPFAQNFEQAAEAVRIASEMIAPALASGHDVLALGGNCTIALATMSALTHDQSPALLYMDRHFDLNTPSSTTDGALDWMGMASALGVLPNPPDFGFTTEPLLSPDQLLYIGITADAATEWERSEVERLGVQWRTNDELATVPHIEATFALDWLDKREFAVHLDLDVLDFIDLPLSENTDGRNSGPSLEAIATFLGAVCAATGFRALSIGELNPSRAAGTPNAIPRFVETLGRILA